MCCHCKGLYILCFVLLCLKKKNFVVVFCVTFQSYHKAFYAILLYHDKKLRVPIFVILYQFTFYAFCSVAKCVESVALCKHFVQYNSGLIWSPTTYLSSLVYLLCVIGSFSELQSEMSFHHVSSGSFINLWVE